MSSQIMRLYNGDNVQIRTGTIQGIGPQGPTGATGPTGPAGDQGPQGEKGEVGFVDESALSVTDDASLQSVAASTPTLVNVPTTVLDDFTARQSTSTFAFPVGNYVFSAIVGFGRSTGTPTGYRTVRLLVNNVVEWEAVIPAVGVASIPTVVTITGGIVISNASHGVALQVLHNDGVSLYISKARLWVSRIGAGLQGEPGPQGDTGAVGATGAQGPQGPAGTIGDNNTTFGALGGDNS